MEKTKRTESLDKIIESIAKEEVAISKIMKAEALKIRKVVKTSKSIEGIKEINESVRKTIQELVKLNMILQFKLETVKDMK